MTYDELQSDLADVAFTTATPFSDNGDAVLTEEIATNVRTLYDSGARVFIPCGNTGEYYSLSRIERIDVVRTTVESLPGDATVIGGAGGSTKDTIELLAAYEDAGTDAAMIMSPGHAYIHERGLIDYYRTLASATDLGLVLYKRGPYITERVIDELSRIDNVVAVKYAVNDVKTFSRLTETVSGDLVWLDGVAERYAPAYALEGADGFTTGIGNFVPEEVLALERALTEEDWDRARRIRNVLQPFEDLREEGDRPSFGAAKNVPAVKSGQEYRGLYGGPIREPLVELSDEDRERVKTYIDEIQQASLK